MADEFEVKALFAYTATTDKEMSFQKGDIIRVSREDTSGWMKGRLGNATGWFPGSYVEKIAEKKAPSPLKQPGFPYQAKALFGYTGMEDKELTFKDGDVISVIKADPSGWMKGELNGRSGWFPESFVTPMDVGQPAITVTSPPPTKTPQVAKVEKPAEPKAEPKATGGAYTSTLAPEPQSETWSLNTVLKKLNSFFRKRPTKEDLIRKKILPPDSQRLFGMDLEAVLRREGTDFPVFCTNAIDFLMDKALDEEGLFRISASASHLQQWRLVLDYDGASSLEPIMDNHLVAALLKLYIRELPTSVISLDMYARLAEVFTSGENVVEGMADCLNELKPAYCTFLKRVMAALAQVADPKHNNKMNGNNISIIFAQNFFEQPEGFDTDMLKNQTGILKCMLDKWPEFDQLLQVKGM